MYEVNFCSPIWDIVPKTIVNVHVIRLVMVSNLLFLYLMYLIVSFIQRKQINDLRLEDQSIHTQRIIRQQKNLKNWQKQYLLMFGDHSISLGFIIAFSPYSFEVIISIIYSILRLFYQIRRYKFDKSTKFIKTALRIINLALLVCAMIGISRCDQLQNGTCVDKSYNMI